MPETLDKVLDQENENIGSKFGGSSHTSGKEEFKEEFKSGFKDAGRLLSKKNLIKAGVGLGAATALGGAAKLGLDLHNKSSFDKPAPISQKAEDLQIEDREALKNKIKIELDEGRLEPLDTKEMSELASEIQEDEDGSQLLKDAMDTGSEEELIKKTIILSRSVVKSWNIANSLNDRLQKANNEKTELENKLKEASIPKDGGQEKIKLEADKKKLQTANEQLRTKIANLEKGETTPEEKKSTEEVKTDAYSKFLPEHTPEQQAKINEFRKNRAKKSQEEQAERLKRIIESLEKSK
ncbi:MAG: hypothetical protein ACD_31C00046G0001 [uncultured bacterium]|nr:MAG: hypothetical protein ACD_31C00046G0001 [uncultured bacterium]